MNKKKLAIGTVILAMVALMSTIIVHTNLTNQKKAPDFTLPTISGDDFTLSDCFKRKKKIIVLDVWATWCPACRLEIPYLINLQRKYKNRNVAVVGVALDDNEKQVRAFAKNQKINYTIALDPSSMNLGKNYNIKYIPITFIIDKEGVIRYTHAGFMGKDNAARIEKDIKSLVIEG